MFSSFAYNFPGSTASHQALKRLNERPKPAFSDIKNAPSIPVNSAQPEKADASTEAPAQCSAEASTKTPAKTLAGAPLGTLLREIAGLLPENLAQALPSRAPADIDPSMFDRPSRRPVDEHEAWVRAHTLSDEVINLWVQNSLNAGSYNDRTPPRTPPPLQSDDEELPPLDDDWRTRSLEIPTFEEFLEQEATERERSRQRAIACKDEEDDFFSPTKLLEACRDVVPDDD